MQAERDHISSPERTVEVALIAVNFDSAKATAQLVGDVVKQNPTNCKVTVVIADNGPTASGLDRVREQYCDHQAVRFETMPENLGYFGAAHHALHAVWKHRLPDWVIVSNADIRLPQKDLFSRIANLSSGLAVIAPRIISMRSGLDQNPFHRERPSAFRMYLNRIIPRLAVVFWLCELQFAVKQSVRRWFRSAIPAPPSQPEKIYAPHGAFVIFSREYFERGGSLNVGAFLFAEEKFVAESCRRLGLDVLYDPTIEVNHDEHVSTGSNPAVRGFQVSAADYIYREFFARGVDQRESGLA
jgi:GT2 family glycosyltransferase